MNIKEILAPLNLTKSCLKLKFCLISEPEEGLPKFGRTVGRLSVGGVTTAEGDNHCTAGGNG